MTSSSVTRSPKDVQKTDDFVFTADMKFGGKFAFYLYEKQVLKMRIIEESRKILTSLREKRPLVHCITNYVTAGDTANMLLAAGASPIMADDPNEAAEVSAAADALVLNMGTLSEKRLDAMISAGAAANQKGIAVVLDPVGVQLTEFRKKAARELISRVRISIIRGNISEISFIADVDDSAFFRGVDCFGGSAEKAAQTAAKQLGCVCAVTGERDVITDGSSTIILDNGCLQLRKITGAGCMSTALCAAFSAVAPPLEAAVFGTAFMGICGETAASETGGNAMGSFRAALFDAAGMNDITFTEGIRAYEYR